jgi:hypothetical protein
MELKPNVLDLWQRKGFKHFDHLSLGIYARKLVSLLIEFGYLTSRSKSQTFV